jgi:hypothetical protein
MWLHKSDCSIASKTVAWLLRHWNPALTVAAFIVAIYAVVLNRQQMKITADLSQLDFRPSIRLNTLLNPINKIQPHYTIENVGSVDAVQIRVEMIAHRFFPSSGKIQVQLRNSETEVVIDKLPPQSWRNFGFPKGWLDTNARLANQPECNVMEIWIRYRRPQDLKEYNESAFYFISPDGLWVPETDSCLSTEFYQKLKEALFEAVNRKGPLSVYNEYHGDRLHPRLNRQLREEK